MQPRSLSLAEFAFIEMRDPRGAPRDQPAGRRRRRERERRTRRERGGRSPVPHGDTPRFGVSGRIWMHMKSKGGGKGALIGAAKSPAHRGTRDRLALGAAGSRSRTNAGGITKGCWYGSGDQINHGKFVEKVHTFSTLLPPTINIIPTSNFINGFFKIILQIFNVFVNFLYFIFYQI